MSVLLINLCQIFHDTSNISCSKPYIRNRFNTILAISFHGFSSDKNPNLGRTTTLKVLMVTFSIPNPYLSRGLK